MKLDLVSNLKYWLLTINNTHNFVLPVMYGETTHTIPNTVKILNIGTCMSEQTV